MNREPRELPILFKGEMVNAILNARPDTWPVEQIDPRKPFKWQTRRIVKPQPIGTDFKVGKITSGWPTKSKNRYGLIYSLPQELRPQLLSYAPEFIPSRHGQPGDILYVRETWKYVDWTEEGQPWIAYAADNGEALHENYPEGWADRVMDVWENLSSPDNYTIDNRAADRRWRPGIHMPQWASRIILLNKDLRVERLQDITNTDAYAEGVSVEFPEAHSAREAFVILWDSINAKPKPVRHKKQITHYESYPWDDIQETREHRGKPWYVIGNPYVWVLSFMRTNQQLKSESL